MSKNHVLSIIIPVNNESENILETLKMIKRDVNTVNEIIIVYDNDNDTTLPILKPILKKNKSLKVVKNTVMKGASGAIRTGILNSKSDIVLVSMADHCDDLTQVDYMVKLLKKGYDLACPSRYTEGGRQELNSKLKVGFPKFAGYILKLLTGIPTSDPTNSYKMYSRKLLNKMNLRSTVSFSVTFEITVKTHLLGGKIIELPTVWKDRQHGKTNFKLGRSIVSYTPWLIAALFKNRIFNASFILKPII